MEYIKNVFMKYIEVHYEFNDYLSSNIDFPQKIVFRFIMKSSNINEELRKKLAFAVTFIAHLSLYKYLEKPIGNINL